jgi:DNA-binding transcriptional MerR regulator
MLIMSELVERTGFPERTIRNYIKHGVIPVIDETVGPHGYGEMHVRLLQAIAILQSEGVRKHHELRARLEAMSPAELSRFIGEEEEEEQEESLAPPAPDAAHVAPNQVPAPLESQARLASQAPAREDWERIVLAPGLELHLRRDATPEVRRMAEEIARR